jgi:hypothetical protein
MRTRDVQTTLPLTARASITAHPAFLTVRATSRVAGGLGGEKCGVDVAQPKYHRLQTENLAGAALYLTFTILDSRADPP